LPARQKRVPSDEAKHLLSLVAGLAIFVPARDQSLRAGDHSSAQQLFASAPRHVLKKGMPGCQSRTRASSGGHTHNQERFVFRVGIRRVSQLDQSTQHRPVARHRDRADIRQQQETL
jgi:hypothetical protein